MFDEFKLTHIENLATELLEIPTIMFQLSQKELKTMLDVFKGLMDNKPLSDDLGKRVDKIGERIDNIIKNNFPDGCFIKLGSRSPKDAWLINKYGMCCKDGKSAVALLFDSERIMDDLRLAEYNNYLPYIVLRKWIDIDPWREFRCFIRNGELVGISQYFYQSYFPEIIENKEDIEKVIKDKVKTIRSLLPTNTVIVDFVYNNDKTTTIIEFNPYDIDTDPCLFNWKQDTFRTFKFKHLTEEPNEEKFSNFFVK